MIETNNVVERLRRKEQRFTGTGIDGKSINLKPETVLINPDGPEAADEIERLRSENQSLSDRIDVLEGENALMRQAVDSAIVQKMETHTHGGLTEFGEGGLAALKSLEREFCHVTRRASLTQGGKG